MRPVPDLPGMKILVCGLPGSGKTTLASALAQALGAVHFNADVIRATVNRDLSFSVADRIEHARRMGGMCQVVVDGGHWAIADLVCPTAQTRFAFGSAYVIWMNTISSSRYADTNALFEPPQTVDLMITNWAYKLEDVVAAILAVVSSSTDRYAVFTN